MSDEMIKYKWIEKWDGKTPKATGTDSLLQLPLDDQKQNKEKEAIASFYVFPEGLFRH